MAPLHPVTVIAPRPAGNEPGDVDIVEGSRTPTLAVDARTNVTHESAEAHDAAVIPPRIDQVAPPFVVTMLLVLPNARQVAGAAQVTPL